MSGRFTQNCLENIFSIRIRHPIPNALQFKQNLKLLAISKYLHISHTSNYDNDGDIVGDFLNISKKGKIKNNVAVNIETTIFSWIILN